MKGVLFSLLKEVTRKHQKPLTVGIKEQKLFHCLPLEDPEGLNNRGNLYTDDSLQRSKQFKTAKTIHLHFYDSLQSNSISGRP